MRTIQLKPTERRALEHLDQARCGHHPKPPPNACAYLISGALVPRPKSCERNFSADRLRQCAAAQHRRSPFPSGGTAAAPPNPAEPRPQVLGPQLQNDGSLRGALLTPRLRGKLTGREIPGETRAAAHSVECFFSRVVSRL